MDLFFVKILEIGATFFKNIEFFIISVETGMFKENKILELAVNITLICKTNWLKNDVLREKKKL